MTKGHRTPGGVAVDVKGKNMSVTSVLRDHVIHKMERLDKYLDRLNEIEIELSTEKTRDAAYHNLVEATARVRGRTIRAATSNADMYTAIDDAVDKLYRQLNRAKERMKSHHGARLETLPSEGEVGREPPGPENGTPEGEILVESLEMKPMFEDEALEELLAGERDFYVFLNARNEVLNVLYRRAEGNYGLIEPSTH
jgi:putative sigma-54 modulation protein